MPDLFARFALNTRHIIQVDNVWRLSSSCFKKRKTDECLSVFCIDDCVNCEEVFDLGSRVLRGICGYGQLEYEGICSVEYCDKEHLCCSVVQSGVDSRHFEIHPGRKDMETMEKFQQIKACELMEKGLSERSLAFLIGCKS